MKARRVFTSFFKHFQQSIPFSTLSKLGSHPIIFPFYHTVSDQQLPHISNLYRVKTVKQFEKDVDFLLKTYQPISITDLLENKTIKGPAFLLSFDDGLKEFDELIAPVLLKKGIPAVNFLNTAFIDNKALFFRYKVSLLIQQLIENTDLLKVLKFDDLDTAKNSLLGLKYNDCKTIDMMAQSIEFDFDNYLNIQQPYLSSEQIKALIKKGFHFGAHSIDHPEYQFLPENKQLEQTYTSIDIIQEQFRLKHTLFSFPFTDFGVKKSFFEQLNKLRDIDYTFGSAGQKKEFIANHIQRIPFENGTLSAEEILKTEYFYYLLKKPLGKNTIQR